MAIPVNKAIVGKEYPPYTVTVERGRIKDFARAIGDLNPFYLDDEVGRCSAWGDIIAPPTFATTFRDESRSAAMLADLGVDISRVLHGEQEFEIHRQLQPGQTYLCRTKVLDIYEKAGRSGPMAFIVRETAVTDRDNEIVATMRHITVVRL
ncbi:MAG: MaoC family dehydratase [Candidatus Rokuibacteriota bacterium]|nr:MAG: MaoC family dehydratase [Candidatus Rokubacteria bacterium]